MKNRLPKNGNTAYIGCDLQIGLCKVSASYRGISRSVPVGFVEDEVLLGQVTVRVILFSPLNIIPQLLHTHLHVHVSVTGRTSGQRLGTFSSLSESGKRCVARCCNCCCGLQKGWAYWQHYSGYPYDVCVCVCVYIYIYIDSITAAILMMYIHTDMHRALYWLSEY
jgi:hypothetical protein